MPNIDQNSSEQTKLGEPIDSNAIEIPNTGATPNNNEFDDEMESDTPLRLFNSSANELNLSEDEEGGYRVGDIYIPPPIKPYCSAESKGPRLIITKIDIQNFKSYAGKVTLGPFHHSFTAIIGPNGSGKSNVIDAMLFVFGYRAQKIRCKKLSVLLHNSARYPNTAMSTVAVHFVLIVDQADESCEIIKGSEIVIARSAFKDNSSFYTINGKRVQFKEVSKLLKEHGVDLDHNRFLILQGEVESIAMMKSKGATEIECGMLEYLEDIIGTTRYKDPLVKICTKVDFLTDDRTEKHNRCKMAEREMKDLEIPYTDAIDFLKLENSLARTKNLQIQKYLSEQNKKLLEFSTDRDLIAIDLIEEDKKLKTLKEERIEKEKSIKEEIEKYDRMRRNKEEMEANLKLSLNKFTETQATMSATNDRRKANKKELFKLDEKLSDLEKIPSKNDREIRECTKKVETLNKEKTVLDNQLQENYSKLEEVTKPLREKREKLETELIGLKKSEDEAKSVLTIAEQELKILQHDELSEKRKFASIKSSLADTESTLKENQVKLNELQTEVPEIKKEITMKSNELQNYIDKEKVISASLMKVKTELTEKTRVIQAARSNNRVLDCLMQQKQKGNIPGILGRLGDLGAIDSKYDIAISTACGRLDNIVVNNVNTAQACIEHLKRSDTGRASFIALEKVQHLQRECNSKIQTPENVPRLFDLITVEDERVLPAFYFALRNTLVANDLDQGTRIAYGGANRFRVVTLQGDVIETSGTMAGGGKSQMKGRMGQKVATKTSEADLNTSIASEKIIEKLQIQFEEMQTEINYCQQEQSRLEMEIRQLKTSLQRKEGEINKIIITIKSYEQQIPRIEDQLKVQEQRMNKTNADPQKVKELEIQIASHKTDFDKIKDKCDKLSKKIAVISDSIADIHNEKVKSIQNKLNAVTKQINLVNGNIAKLTVEIKTSERSFAKIEQKISDMKIDITNCEDQIRSLNAKRLEFDQEGIEWTRKIELTKNFIESANRESSDTKKEISDLQKQESDSNLIRIELEQKLEALNKKIVDVKSQLPYWQQSLLPLKLHIIPGEGERNDTFKTYTEDELKSYKLQDLQYQYSVQEEKINGRKPNLSIIKEYIAKKEVYIERVHILEEITSKRNEMRQLFEEVRKKRYTEFMKGFIIITRKLKEMYQMITQGGDAELELVDSMDPFTEGVTFSVRPPKKTWKNISNLSGGEKTLSSLALVFALHYYKPSPLYFMDEIDAALDFKNISIVAHYIKERTKNAQFIIISLRSNMFELSDHIVGIYKIMDCTSSLTIRNHNAEYWKENAAIRSHNPKPILRATRMNVSVASRPRVFDEISQDEGIHDASSQDTISDYAASQDIFLKAMIPAEDCATPMLSPEIMSDDASQDVVSEEQISEVGSAQNMEQAIDSSFDVFSQIPRNRHMRNDEATSSNAADADNDSNRMSDEELMPVQSDEISSLSINDIFQEAMSSSETHEQLMLELSAADEMVVEDILSQDLSPPDVLMTEVSPRYDEMSVSCGSTDQ